MSNIYLSEKEVDLLLVASNPMLWRYTEVDPYNYDFYKVRRKLTKLRKVAPTEGANT